MTTKQHKRFLKIGLVSLLIFIVTVLFSYEDSRIDNKIAGFIIIVSGVCSFMGLWMLGVMPIAFSFAYKQFEGNQDWYSRWAIWNYNLFPFMIIRDQKPQDTNGKKNAN